MSIRRKNNKTLGSSSDQDKLFETLIWSRTFWLVGKDGMCVVGILQTPCWDLMWNFTASHRTQESPKTHTKYWIPLMRNTNYTHEIRGIKILVHPSNYCYYAMVSVLLVVAKCIKFHHFSSPFAHKRDFSSTSIWGGHLSAALTTLMMVTRINPSLFSQ